MKKKIFISLLCISILFLISCDSRKQLSKKRCKEIYNYAKENFNPYEENDFLYYDYSIELLVIKKEGQLYCNKDSSFIEGYDYYRYIYDIQYIIKNIEPLDITGYKITSKVECFVSITYDFELIKEKTSLEIINFDIAIYENSNIGVDITIFNDEMLTYRIGIIVGDIELSKYKQFELQQLN